ncbi:hypothetical protein HanOQP8_Chr04g0164131 [Helianthus annuus]|nr:hypothetical protein HanIR_Chr04g0200311 [Helianthus annuus]KAJ0759037.1 hypothetical protein HanLR1_Chr04g0157061 [Helianthus annuus]KAJ0762691.1 hypothetical protein HanOQP8_Chr04g0164131 [Helianthus annuus]
MSGRQSYEKSEPSEKNSWIRHCKPFRWYNSWLEREDCEDVVKNMLLGCSLGGAPDIVITRKLKRVREEIRKWWADTLIKEGELLEGYKREIQNLESKMEERELEEEEIWVWEECKKEMCHVHQIRSRDMKQKSRVKWASMGDDNSAFFHRVVNGRKASNALPGLLINGQWITKPSLIKKEVFQFYRGLFSDSHKCRPTLRCVGINQVPSTDMEVLIRPFSKDEIKEAMLDCGSDRAPGQTASISVLLNIFGAFWKMTLVCYLITFFIQVVLVEDAAHLL